MKNHAFAFFLFCFMSATLPACAALKGTQGGAGGLIPSLPVGVPYGGTGETTTQYYEDVSGITNASLCGESSPPSWCAGSEIGAWINAAIAHIGAKGGTVVIDPFGVPYAQTTQVTIPLGIIINGQGSEVRWAATSGTPYVFTSATWVPSTSLTMWEILNLKINHTAGSGDGNTAIAIYAGGDPSSTITPSANYGMMAKLENVDVRGFGKAYSYGNNTWSTSFNNIRFHNNAVGINVPSGTSNSGELIKVTNSVIHDNTIGLSAGDYNQNWAFTNVSWDYNGNAISGTGITAQFDTNHFEQNATGACPISLSSNSNLNFVNTFLAQTGGAAANGYVCMLGTGTTFNHVSMTNSMVGGSVWPTYVVYTNASTGIIENYASTIYLNASHVLPLSDSATTSYGEYAGVSTLWTTGIAEAKQGFKINGLNGLTYPSNDSTAGNTVAVGPSACGGQTGSSAAYRNTCVGGQSMGNGNTMTTGAVQNTAIGWRALAVISSGGNNTGLGYIAGGGITTGSNNMAIGSNTDQSNQTGTNNTAVGAFAATGVASNSHSNDTALGEAALNAVTTGNTNTAIGSQAGNKVTTGAGNTLLGYGVGSTTLTTGANNIIIGVDTSADTAANGTNNTALIKGTGTAVLSATGTNSATIGPAITLGGQTIAPAFTSAGTKFTISGCSAGTTIGGAAAGSFVSGTTGVCTVTVTINGATGLTATNGWSCWSSDETTGNLFRQTSSTATTAIFSGTTVTNDVVTFGCVGY